MSGIGHLGELEVINHLEKKEGFAIYLPIKDKGIDFIAVKDDRCYQIQVKCSTFQKNSYFWFDLKKDRLVYRNNIFYVFVLYTLPRRKFMGKAKNYLIVPSLILQGWIQSGTLATKEGNNNIINVFIYPDFERRCWLYRNKGKTIDLTQYWNNYRILNKREQRRFPGKEKT